MLEKLDDSVVDGVGVTWDDGPTHVLTRVQGQVPAITSLMNVTAWWTIQAYAAGAARHHDRAINDKGFRFPEFREPDDPEFSGVLVYDYFNQVEVSTAAFDRMMARLLRTLVDGATRDGVEAVTSDWWPAFVADTEAVEARVG
ncbi:MAG: hypothetical protein H6745_26290 [Deltaproteobacteria bacterium]|nr:hypothetical protein [Deltaproteobacteria bacterium]